jgi:hypothetical protein
MPPHLLSPVHKRCHQLAGPAPRCPKIHKHGLVTLKIPKRAGRRRAGREGGRVGRACWAAAARGQAAGGAGPPRNHGRCRAAGRAPPQRCVADNAGSAHCRSAPLPAARVAGIAGGGAARLRSSSGSALPCGPRPPPAHAQPHLEHLHLPHGRALDLHHPRDQGSPLRPLLARCNGRPRNERTPGGAAAAHRLGSAPGAAEGLHVAELSGWGLEAWTPRVWEVLCSV